MKRIGILLLIWSLALFSGCQLFSPKNCWVETDQGLVYHDGEGQSVTGWQEIDGTLLHFNEDGLLSEGWQTLGNDTYCFLSDGTPATGWMERDGAICYLDANGVLVQGWAQVDGQTRYFDEHGALVTGWLQMDDAVYYLDSDGAPLTGPQELEGAYYRFREDGSLFTGWLDDDAAARYYYLPNGTQAQGWTEIHGKQYLFREDGSLVTGWYKEDEYRYYFLEDGSPAQGPVEIDGRTYHFTPEGIQIWLVNPWNYLPEDYEVTLISTVNGYKIADVCAQALEQMLADCAAAGSSPSLCSGYRSYWDQLSMFQATVAEYGSVHQAQTIVAIPNTSEHQLGLAVDIVSSENQTLNHKQADSAVQKWLMAHCWDYGFILRYPEGTTEITGIIYEPWHYRYVGIPVAQAVKASGLTLEEYLGAA